MTHLTPRRLTLLTAGGALLLAACGSDGGSTTAADSTTTTAQEAAPLVDPGDGGQYEPLIDPDSFVDLVDNPYYPLLPGTRWVYEGDEDGGGTERIEVEVLSETRLIEGITATVVRDTVYVDGEIAEDTYDWFAQDTEGNVWYLGEDTHEYENGVPVNANGAWEYGKGGALPGIVMPARPAVGSSLRQEYLAGEAEDMFEILAVGTAKNTVLGAYDDVVVTEDWTPLQPDIAEEKWYARGIGNIYSTHTMGKAGTVELIEFTPAP